MPNFLILNHFHPIVISEICSFSGRNSGKNLLKSSTKNFVLENSHKNKQIFQEILHPESLQYKIKNNKTKNNKIKNNKINEILRKQWLDASYNNKIEHVIFFLYNYDNIDVNISMESGYNKPALYLTSQNENIEIVKRLLLVKDINVNFQIRIGLTALSVTVMHENIRILRLLLNVDNIDVNLQDMNGDTALHHAVREGSIEMIEMLLKNKNINKFLQNYRGKTALYFTNNEEIVRMIMK